jgi:RNA polymerase sigma-70 factor (ECF subfamily)
MEDRKLLRLLYKDPSEGMKQLMNEYTDLVYAVVRGKLACFRYVSSDIEDCVADVFSKFYMNLSEYDPSIASIKSYLCVLARNQALNLAKKRNYFEFVSTEDEQSFLILADDKTPEDILIEEEVRKEILCAVEDLGQPDSAILMRKFYYGQSSKQIAAALQLSVSNVDIRTHRAISKLRKMFGGEES